MRSCRPGEVCSGARSPRARPWRRTGPAPRSPPCPCCGRSGAGTAAAAAARRPSATARGRSRRGRSSPPCRRPTARIAAAVAVAGDGQMLVAWQEYRGDRATGATASRRRRAASSRRRLRPGADADRTRRGSRRPTSRPRPASMPPAPRRWPGRGRSRPAAGDDRRARRRRGRRPPARGSRSARGGGHARGAGRRDDRARGRPDGARCWRTTATSGCAARAGPGASPASRGAQSPAASRPSALELPAVALAPTAARWSPGARRAGRPRWCATAAGAFAPAATLARLDRGVRQTGAGPRTAAPADRPPSRTTAGCRVTAAPAGGLRWAGSLRPAASGAPRVLARRDRGEAGRFAPPVTLGGPVRDAGVAVPRLDHDVPHRAAWTDNGGLRRGAPTAGLHLAARVRSRAPARRSRA